MWARSLVGFAMLAFSVVADDTPIRVLILAGEFDLPYRHMSLGQDLSSTPAFYSLLANAIIDYASWPWCYQEAIGGKYFTSAQGGQPASVYREGVEITVVPTKGVRHPVLAAVPPLVLHDEAYKRMWQSPTIAVLMETDYPENDPAVVYIGPNQTAKALTSKSGAMHVSQSAHRTLARHAILWSGRRLN